MRETDTNQYKEDLLDRLMSKGHRRGVLVYLGCHNKISGLNGGNFFLTVQETGKFKTKVPVSLILTPLF